MGRDVALPPGTDPSRLARALHRAHDVFVRTGTALPELRPLVADSWRRSLSDGLDPQGAMAPIRLDDARLAEVRASHPLRTAMPVIRRLLVDGAADAGHVVALSDAVGQLLWVEGDHRVRSRAEAMNFLPGADWSEAAVGTNAPGTALTLDAPVQIFGPEHLARPVTGWSCAAAPIHDPDTGAVLGVLDLSGGVDVASAHSLALVRATVAAVEAELRLQRLDPPRRVGAPRTRPRLDVLGRRVATLRHDHGTTRLSLRHSEILLLLTLAPDGLTAAELGVALSDQELTAVTVRAELSRLRSVLAPLSLDSRPYRLRPVADTDLAGVRRHLVAGELRRAVADYPGPLLPASDAPAVRELREELHRQLRSALLAGTDVDALLSFADTGHGRADYEVWQRVLACLPASSPRRREVSAHVEGLDRELG